MRKKIIFLIGAVFFYIGMIAPFSLQAKEPGKPLRVVCTILPVYVLTLNVVGHIPGVEVKLLLPPHQGCPHNYDLTPSDLIKLSRADLIVANGLGMEAFIEKTLNRTGLKARILLAAQKVDPIQNRPLLRPLNYRGHPVKKGHPDEDSINGHAWASPKSAAVMAQTIAEGLARLDPIHERAYLLNTKSFAQKMERLAREMKDWVSRAKNKKCLIFHDSLAYLARDTGLSIIGVVETHPGIEPSPKDMVRLINILKEEKVAVIFSEPQFSDKIIKSLSRETGVPFFELDPVATGDPAAETYEKAMRKNLEVLRRVIK
jgi:zinc transport system substrate-binding protein